MSKYIVLTIALFLGIIFTSEASLLSDLNDTPPSLETIRAKRALMDASTNSEQFEDHSRAMGDDLKHLFTSRNPKVVHEALYWLYSIRHTYMGMPGLVSKFCSGWKEDHCRFLTIADFCAKQAFLKVSFEGEWDKIRSQSCTPPFVRELTANLRQEEPSLSFTSKIVISTIRHWHIFFRDAFNIYSIFTPRIKSLMSVFAPDRKNFRGWTLSAVSGTLPSREDNINETYIDSLTKQAVIREGALTVDYYVYRIHELAPLIFSLQKTRSRLPPFTEIFLPSTSLGTTATAFQRTLDTLNGLLKVVQFDPETARIALSPDQKKELKEIAHQGHLEAQLFYAMMVRSENPEEARKYYKLAADQGSYGAQFNYALMADRGIGGPKDFEEALKYCRRAAEHGSPESQNHYAFLIETSNGDLKEALHNYKLAANQNHAHAQFNYANLLEEMIKSDFYPESEKLRMQDEALTYYQNSAAQGFERAIERLGNHQVPKRQRRSQE